VATNLSDVGFPDGSDLEALAKKCYQNGKATRCKQGTYIVWALGNGIELWIQLNSNEELIALNPHFFGKTRVSAGLEKRITREGFPMDGGFVSLAQPYGNEPMKGTFRFVFDTPNFLVHEEIDLPQIHSVQLTAFAQQCVVAANEEDFAAAMSRQGRNLKIDAFVPLAMTGPNREPLAEPLASAMICGSILDAVQMTNPATKAQFWWLKIRNAVGEVDVVADPELLPRGVKVGGILQCSAWISGRIV